MTENSEIKLVDSNVLIYAYDKSNLEKYNIAKETIKLLWQERCGALSIQNLVECYSGLIKKVKSPLLPENAKQIILDLIQGFHDL